MGLFEPSPFIPLHSFLPPPPTKKVSFQGIPQSRTHLKVEQGLQQASNMEPLDAESELEKTLRSHDEEMIKRYNSDIDTLLVFAGLFAAVLATFNVQSYQSLQGDGTPTWVIRVNAIWFASLICSLFSASLSILVKQWFREYLNWNCTATEERLRVRHIRYMGLVRWRVFETAAVLPLLLQFSLLLFFAGLSELLRALNHTVWLSTTVLVACWFVPYLLTLLAPAFSSRCPYKTPFLDRWMQLFRGFCSRLLFGKHWRQKLGYKNHYYRFPGDERGVRRDFDLDIPAIISADATLGDNNVLSRNIQHCLRKASGETVIVIVRGLFANRLDRPVHSLFNPSGLERIPTQPLRTLMHILLDAVEGHLRTGGNDQFSRFTPSSRPLWMREAISCLAAIIKHSQVHNRFINPDRCFAVFSDYLALGPEEAEELLVVLAHHFPVVSWDFSETDRHRVLTNTTKATERLVSSAQDDPLRLSGSVFSIVASLNETIRYRRDDVSELMTWLAPTIRAHRMNARRYRNRPWYFNDAIIAQHILGYSDSLDTSLPDIVPRALRDDLIQIRGPIENLVSGTRIPQGDALLHAPYFEPASMLFQKRVFDGDAGHLTWPGFTPTPHKRIFPQGVQFVPDPPIIPYAPFIPSRELHPPVIPVPPPAFSPPRPRIYRPRTPLIPSTPTSIPDRITPAPSTSSHDTKHDLTELSSPTRVQEPSPLQISLGTRAESLSGNSIEPAVSQYEDNPLELHNSPSREVRRSESFDHVPGMSGDGLP